MGERIPTRYGLILTYLRSSRGRTKRSLAEALGLLGEGLLTRYERGYPDQTLTRENLESMLGPLDYDPEAIDVLLFAADLLEPAKASASPVALTAEERRQIDRAAMTAGWTAADSVRAELTRIKEEEKIAAALREADELVPRLLAAPRELRRDLIEVFPELRSWAVARRVVEASGQAAADKAGKALELADLALFIAERWPREESWVFEGQGYCWGFLGNARRVANDFDGSDEAFTRAWKFCQAGEGVGARLFPEWRLLDLEASLRREQHRFTESLELLARALSAVGKGTAEAGRILLKKEFVLEQMGDFEGALAILEEAAPLIDGSGEPRLLSVLHFNTADNLCRLGRYSEAEVHLPMVRELAVQQANQLDLTRVLWLEAKADAGLGRTEKAIGSLVQVQGAFTDHNLPYDAALSSLDLAVLWLQMGSTVKVRELALAMAWIFDAKGIHREALAALALFREAAQQEVATVELTRRVIAEIERVRRSASPLSAGERGREGGSYDRQRPSGSR